MPAVSTKKRCKQCAELLGRSNFNDNKRSRDGLADTCRACVNRRRRELHAQKDRTESNDLVEAARLGQLAKLKTPTKDDPRHLQFLLWKTVQDFNTIKKGPEHVAQARFLIRKGAEPHWTMVGEAARGGHQALIDVLLDAGVEINIFVAAAMGDLKKLTRLLADDRERACSDFRGVTPLHYCSLSALGKKDNRRGAAIVSCAERLVHAGAAVDVRATVGGMQDVRPIQCVCWTGGNIELARFLFENGAKLDDCLRFALGHFQRHGNANHDIANWLIENGVRIRDEGDANLMSAAAMGNVKAVTWLLSHGANPNAKSTDGRRPLHYAAERNVGVKVVKMLIEHGADINAKTTDGQTALTLSRRNDKRVIAAFLKSAGASA